MSTSDAPDWLVELIGDQMRLMSSSPKSVADSVWVEFRSRLELEIKEGLDLRADNLRNSFMMSATMDYRIKEKD